MAGSVLLRLPALIISIVASLRLDFGMPEKMPLGVINYTGIVDSDRESEVARREAPDGLEQCIIRDDEVSLIGDDLNLRS